MISHRVAGDPVEPACEGTPARLVSADVPERLDENLGRYIFGGRRVTQACVGKPVDARDMPIVENAKRVSVNLCAFDQPALILFHARSLGPNSRSVITEFTDCEGGGP